MKRPIHEIMNLIFSTMAVVFSIICFDKSKETKELKEILISIWLLVPPIYFYIEWVFLYKESEAYPLNKFQYSQKLAKDIWVAVSIVLIALYFKGY